MILRRELIDAIRKVCPAEVEVFGLADGEMEISPLSQVRVEVRSELDGACEVVLYSGSFDKDELAARTDQILIRLLSNPPFKIVDQNRGIAFGNAYTVSRA